jgi:hypothetical protein
MRFVSSAHLLALDTVYAYSIMMANSGCNGKKATRYFATISLAGDLMNESIWHKLWTLVLIANDVPPREAHAAFHFLYSNQSIDLNKDPIADALTLVAKPMASICLPADEHQSSNHHRRV